MKILFLCHRVPYPPNKGDRIRSFNILKHLGKKHEVHVVYPSFNEEEVLRAKQIEKYCKKASTVLITNPLMRGLISVISARPSSFNYFYSRKMKELVDGIKCDLIFIYSSQMAMYVINRKEKKIADLVDADSDKWRMYSKMKTHLYRPFYFLEYLKVKRWEKKIANKFDKIIVASEVEKKLLSSKAIVMPNGAEIPRIKKTKKENNSIIFSGAMDYDANIDAAEWFHNKILPLIKKEIKNIKFVIAGMNPTKKLKKLKNAKITGYIPDMDSLIVKHTAYVAPLRIARGMQNKILNAMAIGIPVISTSIANQGIKAKDGKEILIADKEEEFAKNVVRILKNEKEHKKIVNNAKTFVKKKFNWDNNLKILDKAIK